MKRLIASCLATLLLAGTLPGALAAENTMGDELASVAQQVKATLGIDDSYTSFHGEPQSNGDVSTWWLYWEGEGGRSIEVNATAQGKVLNYQCADEQSGGYDGSFAPTFAKLSGEEGRKLAQDFLNRVLTPEESATLTQNSNYRSVDSLAYNVAIALNGVPSPLSGRIEVSAAHRAVVSFWRSDSAGFQGGIPSAKPAVQQAAAAATLYGDETLLLEYTTDPQRSGQQLDTAVLQYVPADSDRRAVDAQTGKLLNINAMREAYARDEAASGGAKNASSDSGLTQAEQEGVEKLQGILNRQQLDAKLRAMPELGLSAFSLEGAVYSYQKEADTYLCSLDYARRSGDEYELKYAYVDAKTGVLRSFFTSSSKEAALMSAKAAQAKAEAFLQKYYPDNYSKTKHYEASSLASENACVYAQNANGYFYTDNRYELVFRQDGTLSSLRAAWRDVAFEKPEGLVTMEAARQAWQAARPVRLAYVAVPVENRVTRGYTEKLTLAYELAPDASGVYGVDAKTGKVLTHAENTGDTAIVYSDVTAADKEITALAAAGVGYKTGTFEKNKELTQVDMLAFLVSAEGWYYDPAEEGALDRLYNRAYNLGMLQKSERKEDKTITRGELVKTILDMSGYGKSAQLQGIFVCHFTDSATIPAAYYGYAAIAQGLGMVRGDGQGRFLAEGTATRGQMAIMLYNFMNR